MQIRDLKAKKKMSLVAEIKALIQKEWRPLRDTRVEEDLQDSFNMDNKRYKGEGGRVIGRACCLTQQQAGLSVGACGGDGCDDGTGGWSSSDFVASEERYKKFRKHIYKARQDMNKARHQPFPRWPFTARHSV